MVHFGTAEAWSWDMIFLAVSLVKNGLGNAEEHQRVAHVSRHTGRLSSTVVHGMFCLRVRSEVTADEKRLCNQRDSPRGRKSSQYNVIYQKQDKSQL